MIMRKLLIAVPTLDYVHSEFLRSLTNLVIHLKDRGVSFDVEIVSGTLVYVARDKLANKAMRGGYSHVLWLDSDMVFNAELVDDLMFSGQDFVSGIYHARRSPYFSCLFKSIDINTLERWENDYPKDTFEIAGCGFGCVLINTMVLKAVNTAFGTCFLPMKDLGEDLAFCKRVSDLNIKMYAEPGVRLGHVGHTTIYPEERDWWRERNEGCR